MVSKVRNKESPYVVGGRDKMSFNEFGVRRTGFYTILKLTLDNGKDCFNHLSLTVQSNYTVE